MAMSEFVIAEVARCRPELAKQPPLSGVVPATLPHRHHTTSLALCHPHAHALRMPAASRVRVAMPEFVISLSRRSRWPSPGACQAAAIARSCSRRATSLPPCRPYARALCAPAAARAFRGEGADKIRAVRRSMEWI
ncbi:hypothetical protein PVAP13_1NG225214 [Panicum virgatum]|uniref:Uncharacterized protein n=1 Tax=Panicum virgatum TaxID=38727 RepID=A0A8T0X3X9_PANVG|nr:hypothetical protein PVAP13_1NG225214 [Panicum virgatum]